MYNPSRTPHSCGGLYKFFQVPSTVGGAPGRGCHPPPRKRHGRSCAGTADVSRAATTMYPGRKPVSRFCRCHWRLSHLHEHSCRYTSRSSSAAPVGRTHNDAHRCWPEAAMPAASPSGVIAAFRHIQKIYVARTWFGIELHVQVFRHWCALAVRICRVRSPPASNARLSLALSRMPAVA